MAIRQKARRRPVARGAKRKRAAKAEATRRPRRASARPALKARRAPETLRLRTFTPGLTVNDIERSLAFYTMALGFVVGERWQDGGVLRGVMLRAGSCELGLSQDDWKLGRDRKKGQGFRLWCETTQNIDTLAARVKAAGFTLAEMPEDHRSWGVRSFAVDDPDGYHLTFARDL